MAGSKSYEDVACPFCGMCCDDLKVRAQTNQLAVLKNGCDLAKQGFERPVKDAVPMVSGEKVTLETAVERAAGILKNSRFPLISGLATDVDGAKAAMNLAEKSGGVIDHLASESSFRNYRVVQNSGWMTTTMGEIRNRADLVIMAGTDGVSVSPRFFERCLWTSHAMFLKNPKDRQVVYLGKGLDAKPGRPPKGKKPTEVPCNIKRLGDVFGVLRALYHGRPVSAKTVGGAKVSDLNDLLEKIKAASYPVIVWSTGEMKGDHGELTVQAIAEFIKDVNETIRMSGFPIGASDNAFGAGQVCTWQAGAPLRTSFAKGYPEHDSRVYGTDRLLESGEADALLWISSFDPKKSAPKSAADIPTIVLGGAAMKFHQRPDVFIPVGVPGLDHKGHYFRADSVASLPLRKLRDGALPSASQVITAIDDKMGGR